MAYSLLVPPDGVSALDESRQLIARPIRVILSSARACGWTLLALALPPQLAAQSITIEHDQVSCLVAGQFPEIHACFDPSENVARARVYFRAEGTEDWFYVEMQPAEACFKGTLPRPRSSLDGIDYYVEATDQAFAESRTSEYIPSVVDEESECAGTVAPYVGTASVVVGSLAGSAFPAGFIGGGLLGVSAGTAAVVGVAGAVVVGGAVVAGGGDDSPAGPGGGAGSTPGSGTNPGTPPAPPAPTPTPTPTPQPPGPPSPNPTPSPSPSPVPGDDPFGCRAGDVADPVVTILEPMANEEVGSTVRIVAEASDPGPVTSGLDQVVFSAEEQGGSRQVAITTLTHGGPRYEADWTIPPCAGPSDNWYIDVVATDRCGRTGSDRVRVKRRASSCLAGGGSDIGAQALLWTSELSLPEVRAQIVANGAEAIAAATGVGEMRVSARRGTNRIEAVLASSSQGSGVWLFSVVAGAVTPGSIRVVSGDVVALGPATVAFLVEGRPGERVIFTFDVE